MNFEILSIKNYFRIQAKIIYLLTKSIRKSFTLVVILLLLNTFLEVLTLSLLLPVLSTFMETDIILSNFITSFFPDSYSLLDNDAKLEFLLLLFVGVYLLKNLISFWFTYTKFSLIFKVRASVTKNLYLSYIKKPYDFFLNFNSSLAMRNFQEEIPMLTRMIFSIITLMQDVVVTAAIFIFLFLINAKVTISVFLAVTIVGSIYFFFIKKILVRWSMSRIFYENLKIKNILESFQSIKEIKIFNKEINSLNLFDYNNKMSIINTRKERTLAQMPKIFFEILIIGLLALSFFYLLKNGQTSGEIITILGIYFFSAIRILPSFNRIVVSLGDYSTCYPSVEAIYAEIKKLESIKFNKIIDKSDKDKLNFSNEISLENISFQYANSSRLILKDINLKIKKNSIIGIFGKTGDGKSTLMNIITGLLNPTLGSIYCDNLDIANNKRSWQNLIGYVAQNVYLPDDTIENNIRFENFSTQSDKDYKKDNDYLFKVIDDSGLTEFVHDLENGLQTMTGESSLKISGGQKQRIGIARAIFRNPDILLLDEATSSLDSKTEKEILTRLEKLKNKMSIIIISHKKDNFKICDQVFELKDGKLHENHEKN